MCIRSRIGRLPSGSPSDLPRECRTWNASSSAEIHVCGIASFDGAGGVETLERRQPLPRLSDKSGLRRVCPWMHPKTACCESRAKAAFHAANLGPKHSLEHGSRNRSGHVFASARRAAATASWRLVYR